MSSSNCRFLTCIQISQKAGQVVWYSHLLKNFPQFIVIPWRRQWHPTPVLLPGKSHGQRSLVGCSPWGPEESDLTEWLPFYFSLSCIGEGNGNPRQCSCLENPRDGGAWWAAVYGVTQSRTQLKWLSSSSRPVLLGSPAILPHSLFSSSVLHVNLFQPTLYCSHTGWCLSWKSFCWLILGKSLFQMFLFSASFRF